MAKVFLDGARRPASARWTPALALLGLALVLALLVRDRAAAAPAGWLGDFGAPTERLTPHPADDARFA